MPVSITPLIITTISFCLGILFGDFLPFSFYYVITIIPLIVFWLGFFINRARGVKWPFIFIYLAIALFGAGYYNSRSIIEEKDISRFISIENNMYCTVTGTVVSFPEAVKTRVQFDLEVERLMAGNDTFEVAGRIKVNVYDEQELDCAYGDIVKVSGKLYLPYPSSNPGVFDYRKYLARKGIYSVMSVYDSARLEKIQCKEPGFITGFIAKLHERIDSIITGAMKGHELQSKVLKGIMLGRRKELPVSVQEVFVHSGVVHVLAVSGLHVGLVTMLFFGFFRLLRLPRALSHVLTIIIVILYVWVTGARPSAVRAAIMMAAGLIALLLDRDKHFFNVVALAAFIILIINPATIFDVGFQLSFIAVTGILYLMPYILKVSGHNRIKNRPLRWLLMCMAVTAGAQAGVYPVIAYYFNKISLVGIITNLAAVPLVTIIVGLGFAMLFAGFISMGAAVFIGAANSLVIGLLIKYVSFFALLTFSFRYVASPSGAFFLFYYAFLGLLPFAGKRAVRRALLIIPVIYIMISLAGNAIGHRGLTITVLDATGTVIHIAYPGGKNLLIYGTRKQPRYNEAQNTIASYLWRKGITGLDLFIVGDYEQVRSGIACLQERFRIKGLYGTGNYPRYFSEEHSGLRFDYKGFSLVLCSSVLKRAVESRADMLIMTGNMNKNKLKEILEKISPKYAIITGKVKDKCREIQFPGIISIAEYGAVTARVLNGKLELDGYRKRIENNRNGL